MAEHQHQHQHQHGPTPVVGRASATHPAAHSQGLGHVGPGHEGQGQLGHDHEGHETPASGWESWRTAMSATLHCLTGCAIGEILGLALATWWGWSNGPSIALGIALAFVFGYSLT